MKNKIIKVAFVFALIFLPLSRAAAASAFIGSVSPGTTANIGSEVYFSVTPSGFNGDISYAVSDSFSGSSVSDSDINGDGVFVWIPAASDAGVHNITVNLSDQSGDTANAFIQITVPAAPTVSIQNLSPSASVNVGQTVSWNTQVSGFVNPKYSASDSVMSSSLLQNSISPLGYFYWTPKAQDVGGHTITVYVTDNYGHSGSVSQSINVGAQATATISALTPGDTIVPRQTVSFTVTPSGFTNPTFSVSDSVWGSSVQSGDINSSGIFDWTPNQYDLGTHLISVSVGDSLGDSASVSQKITVGNTSMSIGSTSPNMTVVAGNALSFAATTTGLIAPVNYTLSDSMSGTTLWNGNINSLGLFSWTPTAKDIGTHSINIYAGDNAGNSVNKNITVTVLSAAGTATASSVGVPSSSAANNKYIFSNPLSVGSTGKDVTALQNRLTALGLYSGPVTGYFGSLTKAAVKRFQAKYGISQVGSVGPLTRAMLNKI
jgi:hypothetical protein